MTDILNSAGGQSSILVAVIALLMVLAKRKDLAKLLRGERKECPACAVYKAQLDRRENDNLELQKDNKELNAAFREIGIKSRGKNHETRSGNTRTN